MTDYREIQAEEQPSWMQNAAGRAWNEAHGIIKDCLLEAAKVATRSRYASRATVDALPMIAANFGLGVGYRESEPRLRERLRTGWEQNQARASVSGLIRSLTAAGYVSPEVRTGISWFEYYVVLRQPFPWVSDYLADGRWGDTGWWGDGGMFTSAVPQDEVFFLRDIVRRHHPVHARCTGIYVVHAGEYWDETAPPGTWDDAPVTWGDDVTLIELGD